MAVKVISQDNIEASSDINQVAEQKAKKEVKALEAKKALAEQLKDVRDDIASAQRRIAIGSNDPVIRAINDQALNAHLARQIEIEKKMDQIARAPNTTSDRVKTIDRFTTRTVQVIDIEVTTSGNAEDAINNGIRDSFVDANGVRDNNERSTGIIPKDNRIATLEIRSIKGQSRATIREFFITGVREDTSEKFQIVQTFGTDFIFFFNRKPLIYTINGILYNSKDKQWRNNFKANYDDFLRGTKLVEGRNKAVLTYDDVVRQGYLIALNYSTESTNPHAIPFSFSMFVTEESVTGEKKQRELSTDQNSGRSATADVVFAPSGFIPIGP